MPGTGIFMQRISIYTETQDQILTHFVSKQAKDQKDQAHLW